jgi:hypothetical protein
MDKYITLDNLKQAEKSMLLRLKAYIDIASVINIGTLTISDAELEQIWDDAKTAWEAENTSFVSGS